MARISSFHPLPKQEKPEYDDKVVSALNSTLREHNEALSHRLTFEDNHNAEVKTIKLYHETEVTVRANAITGVPTGAFLLWSELYDYATLKWKPVGPNELKLAVSWDSTPTASYNVRILVLGG